MNADKDNSPSWHERPKPMRNFRPVGPLTPEAESWWDEFGMKLQAAQREWDRRE